MPYICLARGDLPDGSVQVLDIGPNASTALPTGPQPQGRYVNRPRTTVPRLQSNGKLQDQHVDGLGAFLLDRIEPGGLETAAATLVMTGPVHGDTIVVAGVTFTATAFFAAGTVQIGAACTAGDSVDLNGVTLTAKHAAPLADNEFLDAQAPNTAITSATSLVATIMAHPALSLIVSASNVGGTVDTATITALARGQVGKYTLSQAGGNITVSGATLSLASTNPAIQQFDSLAQVAGGTNAGVGTSFRSTLGNAASIAAMKLATGAGYVVASGPFTATVSLSAVDALGAALVGGGNYSLTVSNSTRLVLDATSAVTGVLNRAHQQWTNGVMTNTMNAILARVDAGQALVLSDINTVLLAQAGAELTNAGGSISTGTVTDLLSVLAGRGYRIARTNVTTGTDYQYMSSTHPTYLWSGTQRGGFTELHRENGAQWGHGEIRPNTAGGDWVAREIAPIRHTVDTDAFKISLASGQLAVNCRVSGMPPITLWPDSDPLPHYPWTFQGALQFPAVHNARVLTVYDDSGNLLA